MGRKKRELFDAKTRATPIWQPSRAMSALERQHRHREAEREIGGEIASAFERVDWPRRRLALSSLREFIRAYCLDEGGLFEYEPFDETDTILGMMTAAATASTPYHLRITRGGGKTTIMIALAAYLVAKRVKRFIVLVASKADLSSQMIDDLASLFMTSPGLVQDFPEISLPLVLLGGSMQRAASQRFLMRPTLCRVTHRSLRFPVMASGCPLVPGSSGGAVVIALGFDGRARGLRIGKRRPDFILLDDLQTDELAENAERVEDARRKVYKTFMRLGSSVDRPAVLMTSTPIQPDDLSESFANDPNWKTETFPLMRRMPSERSRDLWRHYYALKNADTVSGNFAAHSEIKFYAEHRVEMDDGAEPFWRECYNHDGTEISSVQHAMNLFLEDEESFESEYQMRPRRASLALEVPRARVLAAVRKGAPRLVVPPGFTFVCAATDINPSYALTTSVCAFMPDRTCFVLEHLISRIAIDGRADDTAFNQLVFAALAAHGRAIAALPVRISAWGVDASGRPFPTVTTFAKSAPIPACGMTGRSSTRFNPLVKSRIRDAINSTVLCADDIERAALAKGQRNIGARWLAWDADHYKEAFQRAILAEPGAPGGCTLFDGGDHVDFAIQVTNEKLVGKRPRGDGRDEFVWNSADPHDFLDTMGMCYAIAGHNGISGNIAHRVVHRRIKKRILFK